MQKFFQGEEVIFEHTFYSDKDKTTAVDPGTVTLTLEGPDGVDVTPSVTENGTRPADTGKYIASHVVNMYGLWKWRWETTSPILVKQGSFTVIEDNTD
jgi:hypothetical protein